MDTANTSGSAVILLSLLMLTSFLLACGGSSSSSDDTVEMPVQVSISDQPLTGGVPATFTFTLPPPETPFTEVTIDLAKTLEATTITVTP